MTINLSTKTTSIGFKYAKDSDSTVFGEPNTMVIVADGKLMFNSKRLGLTAAEASYLTSAINEKLLKNASITLVASPSTYEYVPGTPKPTITFTLTLNVNNSAQAIRNSNGVEQNKIAISVTKADNTTATVYLTKTDSNTYTTTITMNESSDSDTGIVGFVNRCEVSDNIYCKITSDDVEYVLALTKPYVYVNRGGLIYAGCIDSAGANAKLEPNDETILGVSTFVNYSGANNKGSMTLSIGTLDDDNAFKNSDGNAKVQLSCLNLLSSVSNVQIKLIKPDSATSYYGVIALPTNITLGKFSSPSSDNEYKATNMATNMDSPFILLSSTNFETCTGSNNNIGSKQVIYKVFRTKNALKDTITIKL